MNTLLLPIYIQTASSDTIYKPVGTQTKLFRTRGNNIAACKFMRFQSHALKCLAIVIILYTHKKLFLILGSPAAAAIYAYTLPL